MWDRLERMIAGMHASTVYGDKQVLPAEPLRLSLR